MSSFPAPGGCTRATGPDLHRPAPRPRGHQPAGFRRAAAGRPAGAPARSDDRHRGPQRADDRHRQADRRPGVADPGGDAAAQLRGVRHPAAPDGRRRAGHRAHHRPATRADPARHDRRVRRQPHLDPRRVRRAGDGHRHLRGRARARHPDAVAAAVQDHGDQRRRRTAARGERQGHHPRRHRQDRHRRRPGLRHRVPRQRHRIAVDGRPDDRLQHEHRGGRPRGHDRPRRDHLRVPAGPARMRPRAPTGTPRSRRGASCGPTRAPNSTPRSTSTPRR